MHINTNYTLLFAFWLMAIVFPIQSNQKRVFIGSLQFPRTITNPPMLPLFYKGEQIDLISSPQELIPKKATYELHESAYCREFHILITEDLQQPKSNEIMALETSEQFPYKLFKIKLGIITKQPEDNPAQNYTTQYTWQITELDNTASIQIPINTIIFFMNPNFVQLQNVVWQANDTVCKLPTIVFAEHLDEKTLHMTATKLLLSSCINFRPLHKKVRPIQRTAHNRIITIPGPKNRFIS